MVASHARLSDRGQTSYDWQHYIPLVQRKPGVLRNGAPFADMPEPLQRLRHGLLRRPGGDRVMAQVLAIVPKAGLDAVLVAVELLTGLPAGEKGPDGRYAEETVNRRVDDRLAAFALTATNTSSSSLMRCRCRAATSVRSSTTPSSRRPCRWRWRLAPIRR